MKNHEEYIEDQMAMFLGRSRYFKQIKSAMLPGPIPYHTYDSNYRVDAYISMEPLTTHYPALYNIAFHLGYDQYLYKIGKYDDVWCFTFKDPHPKSYPGGRIITIPHRDVSETGLVELDFNMATNLLCAYSPLYTCGIPDNTLDFAVTAGEIFVPEWLARWKKKYVSLGDGTT
jgi:uncharacterized protein (DUF1684 family)